MTLKTLPVIQPSVPLSSPPQNPFFSWLFLKTRRRILFVILCSPIILPLLFLSFPLLCLSQLYICLCRRQQQQRRREDDRLRRCEEGSRGEGDGVEEDDEEREMGWMLLQRYLEDQLGLVGSVVAVYDCGQDDDHDFNYDGDDQVVVILDGDESRRPLLI